MHTERSSPVTLNLPSSSRIGRTYSVALTGMRGQIVAVEADIGNALPGFTLLGLPDLSLHEAKDRIRAAARNTGLPLTRRHLTVNLTPASLHKRGSLFDLAILMAAWGADDVVRHETGPVFLAALGLDGALQTAPGILPAVMAAIEAGYPHVVVAEEAKDQAALVPGAEVLAYQHVSQVAHVFGAPITPRFTEAALPQSTQHNVRPDRSPLDLADVHGQHEARWALEIAAAGGHHMFLQGPPGAGKTMLAERLPTILPSVKPGVALESAAIHSLFEGHDRITSLPCDPPFEAPHHTATTAALIGGGTGVPRPGAASRAHGGVLFLDEATEFKPSVLDTLRQPLETGKVLLHRAQHTIEFPAEFQLIMAANPCPCGHSQGSARHCRCTSMQRRRYAAKLSGPLLDRMDLQVSVEPITSQHMTAKGAAESSEEIKQRVEDAAQRARSRLAPFGLSRNQHVPTQLLQQPPLNLDQQGQRILEQALDAQQITARGYGRIMRVAWTIADLLQTERPTAEHVEMALYLRLNTGNHHE